MTRDEITELVRRTLADVAPDIEGEPIDPDALFRDQFEFDSMDFLNFVTGLHEATGLDIPEGEAPQLASLNGAVQYLSSRLT